MCPSGRSEVGARNAHAHNPAGGDEPSLILGLRVGCAVQRATIQGVGGGGQLYPKVFELGGGHVAV